MKVVIYLLNTYAPDDMIAETVEEVSTSRQNKETMKAGYGQALCPRVSSSENVYSDCHV